MTRQEQWKPGSVESLEAKERRAKQEIARHLQQIVVDIAWRMDAYATAVHEMRGADRCHAFKVETMRGLLGDLFELLSADDDLQEMTLHAIDPRSAQTREMFRPQPGDPRLFVDESKVFPDLLDGRGDDRDDED
jgi:hypothetical protein